MERHIPSEKEMREALGLDKDSKPTPKVAKSSPYWVPRIVVRLGVRETWGGFLREFIFVYKGISLEEARMEAKKAARAEGLEFWYYLGEERQN